MRRDDKDAYQAWLWGELLLIGLLGAALALFVAYPSLRHTYETSELRLFLDSAAFLAAALVAVLAGVRFSVEGRGLDLLLCTGFAAASAATLVFAVVPVLDGDPAGRAEASTRVAGALVAAGLIGAAPFVHARVAARARAVADSLLGVGILLLVLWLGARLLAPSLPSLAGEEGQPLLFTLALGGQALLSLVALVGFGLRFRSHGEDLDRWLALAATLGLFAALHLLFTPEVSSNTVSQGDFLLLLAYGLLLIGVWRAIRFAEFGRAVAEERARVAREIHDGLAQYLFTISTHASMLETAAAPDTIARLKEAAAAAQQEARFAVLALSSASGNAPFDAALRRYVDLLTADGTLQVELEIGEDVRLAPDEQIEVFRIVQEGLANVRKHAGARRAEVRIARKDGKRSVVVRDDGAGFEGETTGAGQGLLNISRRAAAIGGAFSLSSTPGRGTAFEVTLRT
jgi:signal transduction histidine kinase